MANQLCGSALFIGTRCFVGWPSGWPVFLEIAMKHITLIFLWLQIRALEINADGQHQCLRLVADHVTRTKMLASHATLLSHITRLKSEYRRIKRGHGIRAACLEVM